MNFISERASLKSLQNSYTDKTIDKNLIYKFQTNPKQLIKKRL